jgi:hypothetical protein
MPVALGLVELSSGDAATYVGLHVDVGAKLQTPYLPSLNGEIEGDLDQAVRRAAGEMPLSPSHNAHSPLGAKILPIEQTIRWWRVGPGQHAS